MFRVQVDEIVPPEMVGGRDEIIAVKRFEQPVDFLDMQKLIAAINAKPRKPRETGYTPTT